MGNGRLRVLVGPPKEGVAELSRGGFCFTNPGELLTTSGMVCDCSGTCGCDRSLTGLNTAKGTTTGLVMEMDERAVEMIVSASQFIAGWHGMITAEEVMNDMRELSDSLLEFEMYSPVGVQNSPGQFLLFAQTEQAARVL